MGDALHTHGGVTDAKEARLADAGLVAVQGPSLQDVRTGVMHGPGSTALVTGTTSTGPMLVAVAVNQWVASRGAANGPYRGSLDAPVFVAIGAAPASGSRIDVVYVKQQDSTPGVPTPDGVTAELVAVVQGTSTTGTPAKPTLPIGAEELATVTVAAGATTTSGAGVTIANTARQTVARGAPIPVRTAADRDALTAFPLMTVLRLDTGNVEVRNAANTAWQTVSMVNSGWTSFTPAMTATTTNPTMSSANRVGRYRRIDGILIVCEMRFRFTAIGAGELVGAGDYRFALPVAAGSFYFPESVLGSASYLDAGVSTYAGTAQMVTTTTVQLAFQGGKAGATSPAVPANNDMYTFSLLYEAAS